jgi:3-oxoacyl-[acyl-carrier protein] reductase
LKDTVTGFVATNPIHILVNNTGGPPAGPITEATTDSFLSAFEQHLVCNHILAQACMPGMKAAAYGRIINIISTSVKIPLKGLGVSNTIRGAVASWAKTLAN